MANINIELINLPENEGNQGNCAIGRVRSQILQPPSKLPGAEIFPH